MLSRVGLTKPHKRDWTCGIITCPWERGNHDSSTTVKEIGEIILAERGNQQRRAFIFLKTEGCTQISIRVLTSVAPLRHDDHSQLSACRTKHVHMALRC